MDEKINLGASIIVSAVNNNRSQVTDLLLKNGVVAPSNLTDFQLAQVVTELLKSSKNFQKEFLAFISHPDTIETTVGMSGYSNVSGSFADNFSVAPSPFSSLSTAFTTNGASSLTGMPATSTSTAPKTGFTVDKILNVFAQSLNAYLQLDTNKTNRALANASVVNAQSGGTIPETQIADVSKKSNTTMYVVLAILGIAVVGGGIWYAVKSKKA